MISVEMLELLVAKKELSKKQQKHHGGEDGKGNSDCPGLQS